MFLLYVNNSIESHAKHAALQLRETFAPVFEEIGDIAFIDTEDHLKTAVKSGPEKDNLLVVPFGVESLSGLKINAAMLPTIKVEEFGQFEPSGTAVAVACVGNVEKIDVNSTTQSLPASENKGNSHSKRISVINLDWPLWSHKDISRLRGRQISAEKTSKIDNKANILLDSHAGRGDLSGVIFVANRKVSASLDSAMDVMSKFLTTFHDNEDAILKVNLAHDNITPTQSAEIQAQLRSILAGYPAHLCRVLIIGTTGNSHKNTFGDATYYIFGNDKADVYDAIGYYCAQTPPLLDSSSTSTYGLSSDYPLTSNTNRSLEALLKDAYHIARTAPDGYQQLRRYCIDNAREKFSVQTAVEKVRKVLNEDSIAKLLPSIDNRRDREAVYTNIIGLFDYTQSGWIDKSSESLAPGFPIERSDIVVDVGCGGGSFAGFCSALAGEVVYCDIDPNALEAARHYIAELSQCPTRGVLTSGERLDLADAYADKIICTEVLEHVQNPESVMSELVRIGKPGAVYLISVPDFLNEQLQKTVAPPVYFEPPNHIRIYERSEFTQLVSQSGLEIIKHEYFGFYHLFHWLIKWNDDPSLEYAWAKIWKHLLDHEKGPALKDSLDFHIAKSQAVLARKPLSDE